MKNLRERSPRLSQRQMAPLRILVLAAAGLGCNLISLPSGQTAASPQVIVVTATGNPGANPGGLALTDTPTNALAPTIPEPTITPTFTIQPAAAPKIFGFLACLTECRADGSNAMSAFPEGTEKIYLRWNYENIPAGAHYVRSWENRGEEWVRYDCTWPGPAEGVDTITLTEPQGLRSGIWMVTITVDGLVLLRDQVKLEGDWEYWDPAGSFSTCYGKAASSGGRIAFFSDNSGNDDIYVMDPDGSNLTRLTNDPADDRYPSWSPDGRHIAFSSDRNGNEDIFVMDSDGSHVTPLISDRYNESMPAWSPDGDRIAFESNRYGHADVYVMDADGSNVFRLTDNPTFDEYPAWSPGGNRIAFYSGLDGNAEIYIMDADGSGLTRLTFDPGYDEDPAWSPDEKRIAFSSNRSGNADIYLMDSDGSNVVRLTNDNNFDYQPAWSPDGKRIAFMSSVPGKGYLICEMDADGSNAKCLPFNGRDPDWSR